MKEPHSQPDSVTADTAGHSPAVPAREELPQRVPTAGSNPSRSAMVEVAKQCAISPRSMSRPPVAAIVTVLRTRCAIGPEEPACDRKNAAPLTPRRSTV
ncbi:hypothetical protein ABZ319_00335 [Nocardia sp. NPDC005978]|uniref:hypothetical protein n=1 Tax=Nocardia sp. NPDC005978 TaxID=3156725 RepID=UPI0033BED037